MAPFLGIQDFSISHFNDAAKLSVCEDAALRAVLDSTTAITAKIKAVPSELRQPDTCSISSLTSLRASAARSGRPAALSARSVPAMPSNCHH